ILPTSCLALGYWQVGRRRWKLDLLDRIDENVHKAPVPLPSGARASLDLPEYAAITVRGQFDHSREAVIGPRSLIEDMLPVGMSQSGNKVMGPVLTQKQHRAHTQPSNPAGYFVVTPFQLADRPGESILVNRGWVHLDLRDPATRTPGQVKGIVEISGYVRYPEAPPPYGSFPKLLECSDKEKQLPQLQYYGRQVNDMARDMDTLPLFIDATYDSSTTGGPIGGQTRVNLRNEHMSYIITW
ncbi:SURF1 protein, partial [Fasciolopsis buskii]